jgi:hypothetical protein
MPAGNFGDLDRDTIYGPGFWNIDFSLTKDTKLTERLNLQLRAEFFNISIIRNLRCPEAHNQVSVRAIACSLDPPLP